MAKPRTDAEFPETVSTDLPAGTKAQIRKLAKARGWDLSKWLRIAVLMHVAREQDRLDRLGDRPASSSLGRI